nr:hypothetical protein [Kibdelosporangium sp. MJ126-NF4]CTQ93325.1 hypothetical protein [Kibdelosporangium sp. MJ126-NF4]
MQSCKDCAVPLMVDRHVASLRPSGRRVALNGYTQRFFD